MYNVKYSKVYCIITSHTLTKNTFYLFINHFEVIIKDLIKRVLNI